ncbi:hypothetical protein [Rhodococcoides fascians]|uniref:hypothetical protein n=1 Tax=Rhodococcoides fascians TaxID=1828 RepID=UPI00050D057C|nr:hypothetical protein [Rhodococcus fascians]
MNLMTREPAGLVTERAVPAFGHYSAAAVSLDSALDQIVSSGAAIARAVNGHSAPHVVAELISSRLTVGFGAVSATVFFAHHEQIFAVSGVIIGVNEMAVQFADDYRHLRTWPLATAIALILN